MAVPQQPPPPQPERARGGFALVISLSLMALVLLLLLSLSNLLSSRTSATKNQLLTVKAKQNALLGAKVAMGNLQRSLGPDQRVSAPANLAGASDDLRNYIGVWDTTDPSNPLSWLISGQSTPSAPRNPSDVSV